MLPPFADYACYDDEIEEERRRGEDNTQPKAVGRRSAGEPEVPPCE